MLKSILLTSLAIDFSAQAVGFLHAAWNRTEKLYDFFGAGSFLALAGYSYFAGQKTTRTAIASSLTALWALRLGSFLVARVMIVGKDKRFDEVKSNIPKFAVYWFMQGVWVYSVMLPVLFLNGSDNDDSLGLTDKIGIGIWAFGFITECVADYQKWQFKRRQNTSEVQRFIDEGLWSYSRHPNYFGEITLWIGMYLLSWNGLDTVGRAVGAISPFMITTLLLFGSGVPILEAEAERKWGSLESYQKYKREVSLLVPLPRGWNCKSD